MATATVRISHVPFVSDATGRSIIGGVSGAGSGAGVLSTNSSYWIWSRGASIRIFVTVCDANVPHLSELGWFELEPKWLRPPIYPKQPGFFIAHLGSRYIYSLINITSCLRSGESKLPLFPLGDGHEPNSVGVYIPVGKDFLLKVGWPKPIFKFWESELSCVIWNWNPPSFCFRKNMRFYCLFTFLLNTL